MAKRAVISGLVVVCAAIIIAIAAWTGGGLASWVMNQRRPTPRMPTITTLHDIRGLAVLSPVVLKSRTAMLLIKDLFILPGRKPELKP